LSPVAKFDAIFLSVHLTKPTIRATYQSAPLLLFGSAQTSKRELSG